tara:strand:- start:101 stop:295 length:195 start_codon:yes stop_codon:yes gene_type:complete
MNHNKRNKQTMQTLTLETQNNVLNAAIAIAADNSTENMEAVAAKLTQAEREYLLKIIQLAQASK